MATQLIPSLLNELSREYYYCEVMHDDISVNLIVTTGGICNYDNVCCIKLLLFTVICLRANVLSRHEIKVYTHAHTINKLGIPEQFEANVGFVCEE